MNISNYQFFGWSLIGFQGYSQKLNTIKLYFEGAVLTIILLLCLLLMVITIFDLVTGQIKRDYYSVQLGKHLQRNIGKNNSQLVESEQEKANYWLKRLRIIKWRHRIYLLIPCGPKAAVQEVIRERCENYLIDWLNLNMSRINWTNRINKRNSLHFNWLIVAEKSIWGRK